MISSRDRSGYIGASDADYVMQSWKTKSFEKWWRIKQGIDESNYKNDAMLAGTFYEHKILDSLELSGLEKDKQIILGRLRVNLDGNTNDTIYEVKTYRLEKGFTVPLKYRRQVNVQMYASGLRKAYIIAYGLIDEDYDNFYREIDMERLEHHEIKYDEDFIKNFLVRFNYLSACLDSGEFPNEDDFYENDWNT